MCRKYAADIKLGAAEIDVLGTGEPEAQPRPASQAAPSFNPYPLEIQQ